MDRKLEEYRQKRDATRTNEPLGDEPPRRAGPTLRGAFVIHQHAATGMHWDLRLEVGGVLASFAVPHGVTLDPDARHLAMHTEDHPIEYLDFEAVIPEGTYGAGPMIVWDYGAVRYLEVSAEEGLATGKLHFHLDGRKVRGRFGLVRMQPKNAKRGVVPKEWLLLKKKDEFADASRDLVKELPRSVFSGLTVGELAAAPKLATDIEELAASLGAPAIKARSSMKIDPMLCAAGPLPTGDGWLHELKLDGVRIIATKDDRAVRMRYRSQRDATPAYPEVARAIGALAPRHVMIDGEVVAFDEQGRPSFTRLASRIHGGGGGRFELREAMIATPVCFMAFDLLEIGARDLRPLPLVVRKELLGRLILAPGTLRVLDHLEGGGEELLAFCRAKGLEGVVSKKATSPYREGGKRTGDWVKTKCEKREDFVVVGYTVGETNRAELGALEVASYEGDELILRGRVGSGLDEGSISLLLAKLRPLAVKHATARGEYSSAPKGRTHVKPQVVVSVRYLEWSDVGHLRFPVYLGMQPDRDPRSCTVVPHWGDAEPAQLARGGREEPAPSSFTIDASSEAIEAAPPSIGAPPSSRAAPHSRRGDEAPASFPVVFTNRQKLYFPEDGITKGELVDYYVAVGPWMLPYLADRPVMLVRYPDGIHGKHFYQWNVPHGMPGWVRSVSLGKHARAPVDDDAHQKHVFVLDRLESVAYVANLGCIPIHLLSSRVAAPEEADYLVIDFDVGRASLRAAIPLAHLLREICDAIGLPAFPKTSGQSGLHVFVSLGVGTTPDASRTLADLLGRMLIEAHPKVATMDRVVTRRGERVYVDTGQTGASRTIVAPWSVRATPGARVSTPLRWEEVTEDLDPARFTIRTVLDRVRSEGDPMAPLLTSRPDMEVVMRKLASLLASRNNAGSK